LEDKGLNAIHSSEEWIRIIQDWINMVEKENHLDDGKKISEDPLVFISVDRTIHPADDPLSKWDLGRIFNNRLESPVFVNTLFDSDE
jgi:hypothetical protein